MTPDELSPEPAPEPVTVTRCEHGQTEAHQLGTIDPLLDDWCDGPAPAARPALIGSRPGFPPRRASESTVALEDAGPAPAVAVPEEDRSAGRWCEHCQRHGSHHTDRHPSPAVAVEPAQDALTLLEDRLRKIYQDNLGTQVAADIDSAFECIGLIRRDVLRMRDDVKRLTAAPAVEPQRSAPEPDEREVLAELIRKETRNLLSDGQDSLDAADVVLAAGFSRRSASEERGRLLAALDAFQTIVPDPADTPRHWTAWKQGRDATLAIIRAYLTERAHDDHHA